MALDYSITFPKKTEEKEELIELIKNQDYKYFILSKLITSDVGYLESNFDNENLDLEFKDYSSIGIRLDKFTDTIETKKSMMQLVYKIVNDIYPNEDYYFDFNGDIIYEKRINGVVKRNSKSDFYKHLEV